MHHAVHITEIGGQDATKIIEKDIEGLLLEKGLNWETVGQEKYSLLRDIKNKVSEVADSYDEAIQQTYDEDLEQKAYVLPDGAIIELSRETRFKAGEVLLDPTLMQEIEGYENKKIPDIVTNIIDSLTRCDPELTHVNIFLKLVSFC